MPPKSSSGKATAKNSVPKDKQSAVAREFKNAIRKQKAENQYSDDDSLGSEEDAADVSGNGPSQHGGPATMGTSSNLDSYNGDKNSPEDKFIPEEDENKRQLDHQEEKHGPSQADAIQAMANRASPGSVSDTAKQKRLKNNSEDQAQGSDSGQNKKGNSLPDSLKDKSAKRPSFKDTSVKNPNPSSDAGADKNAGQAPGLDAGPEKSAGQAPKPDDAQKPEGDKNPGDKKPEDTKKKPYEAGGGPGGEINPAGDKKPGDKKPFEAGGGKAPGALGSAARDSVAAAKKAGAATKRKLNEAKQAAKAVKNAVTAPARKAKAAAAAIKNKITAPARKLRAAKDALKSMIDDLNPFKKLKEVAKEIWRLIPVLIRMLLAAKGLGPFVIFLDKLLKKDNVDKCLTCGCCTCATIPIACCMIQVLIVFVLISKVFEAFS